MSKSLFFVFAIIAIVLASSTTVSARFWAPKWQTSQRCGFWSEAASCFGYTFVSCQDSGSSTGMLATETQSGKVVGNFVLSNNVTMKTPSCDILNPVSNIGPITSTSDGSLLNLILVEPIDGSKPNYKVAWRYGGGKKGDSASPPVAYNGNEYVFMGGSVQCVNLLGDVQWKYPVAGGITGMPDVNDWNVLVTTSTELIALGQNNGKPFWSFKTSSGEQFVAPAQSSGRFAFAATSSKVFGLAKSTGAHIWTHELQAEQQVQHPATPCGSVVVYVESGHENAVAALDVSSGKELWRNATFSSNVSLSGMACDTTSNIAYVGGKNGILYALDAVTGKIAAQYDTKQKSGSVRPSVQPGTTTVTVGFHGNTFMAFDAPK